MKNASKKNRYKGKEEWVVIHSSPLLCSPLTQLFIPLLSYPLFPSFLFSSLLFSSLLFSSLSFSFPLTHYSPFFALFVSYLNLKVNSFRLSSGYQSSPFAGCDLSLSISNSCKISIFPTEINGKR